MKLSLMDQALLKGVLKNRMEHHLNLAARCTTKAADTHRSTFAQLEDLLDRVTDEVPVMGFHKPVSGERHD